MHSHVFSPRSSITAENIQGFKALTNSAWEPHIMCETYRDAALLVIFDTGSFQAQVANIGNLP